MISYQSLLFIATTMNDKAIAIHLVKPHRNQFGGLKFGKVHVKYKQILNKIKLWMNYKLGKFTKFTNIFNHAKLSSFTVIIINA